MLPLGHMTTMTEKLLTNVNRQAVRLSSRLNIPRTLAKRILAKSSYRCSNWEDLEARLKSGSLDKHIASLAALPYSSSSVAYFSECLPDLCRALRQLILTNTDLSGLYQTLKFVFGISDKAVQLSEIFPSLRIDSWSSMNIGPDPNAVITAGCKVNGVPLMLIGTRVYMPKYFRLDEDLAGSGHVASPFGEPFKIIWSNQKAWYDATVSYLRSDPENDDEDFSLELPQEPLDAKMVAHQAWFNRNLDTWGISGSYGDEEEEFFPYIETKLGCYLVFGVPSDLAFDACANNTIPMPRGDDNDSRVILLNDQPMSFEWFSVDSKTRDHNGQYQGHFSSCQAGVFSHPDCDTSLFYLHSRCNSSFFIRPITSSELRCHLKVEFEPEASSEAFSFKSDHPAVASIVIDKIATRNLAILPSSYGTARYVMELDVSGHKGVQRLSMSLDALGNDYEGFHNLIEASVLQQEGTRKTLYLSLSPTLLSLADAVSKKELKDAIQFGLILRRPAGFHAALKHSPKRCANLKLASSEVSDAFECPLPVDVGFDLFQHATITRYRRDNY